MESLKTKLSTYQRNKKMMHICMIYDLLRNLRTFNTE